MAPTSSSSSSSSTTTVPTCLPRPTNSSRRAHGAISWLGEHRVRGTLQQQQPSHPLHTGHTNTNSKNPYNQNAVICEEPHVNEEEAIEVQEVFRSDNHQQHHLCSNNRISSFQVIVRTTTSAATTHHNNRNRPDSFPARRKSPTALLLPFASSTVPPVKSSTSTTIHKDLSKTTTNTTSIMTATTGTSVAPQEPLREAPMPSLVDEDDTITDPAKDSNDNDHDESPTESASSLAKEGMGQEALWVEEKSLLSGARQHGSPSKMKLLFRGGKKKNTISEQPKQRHVLLLGEEDEDAQALGTSVERQAAQNILMARHLLEQALHPAAFVNNNPNPETLAQSAFELACEARRCMDDSNKKNSVELDRVLNDAITKGVAAVRASQPDRARQLLEFVLPALPDGDALLQQQLPNVATFDTGMSTLTTKLSYFLQSPRANNNNHNQEDVLSMSSLNEILDGPPSPAAPRVPHEICAVAAKVADDRPEEEENDDQNSVGSSSTSSSGRGRRRRRRNRKSKTTTKAVTAATAITVVAATAERQPRSGIFFGRRFKGSQKVDENQQQLQRLAPIMGEDKNVQAEEEAFHNPVPGQAKQVVMSVQDQRIVDMDARISQILLKAAGDDDTCSLTSRDGVPVHTRDLPKHVQERERKIEQALSQDSDDDHSRSAVSYRPGAVRTFELPQFVPAPQRDPAAILGHASLDGLQAAGMIDEDDGVIPAPPSPASTMAQSLDDEDDKYTVIAQGEDVTEDKYSMLPDCAFCDALWRNMKALPSASPTTLELEEDNDEAPETLMDKYATEQDEAPAVPEIEEDELVPTAAVVEAPDTAPTMDTPSTDDAAGIAPAMSDDAASHKSTASSKRRGMAGRLFGKLKSSSKRSTADDAAISKLSRGGLFGSKKHSTILQEKSQMSLNELPRTKDEDASSSLFKITVTSNEELDDINDNKHSLLHEADAATEGSEEPEVQPDTLGKHIRAQQQRAKNRPPVDP